MSTPRRIATELPPHLQTLLAAVPRLTRAQADALAADECELRHLAAASAAELKESYGISLPVAVDLRAAAQAAMTGADQGPADIAALLAHLSDLTSPDLTRVTAAVDALEARGFVAVPVDGQGAPDPTAAQEVARATREVVTEAVRVGRWRGLRFLRLSDLRPAEWHPRSPTSKVELQGEGAAAIDPRTGIAWGRLSEVDLGLAHVAVDERLTGGLTDQALLADMFGHGPAWERARTLVDGQVPSRAEADAQLRQRAQTANFPARGSHDSSAAAATVPVVPGTRLDQALLGMFSESELRRVILFALDRGEQFLSGVRSGQSPADFFYEVTSKLRREGYLTTPEFWSALGAERPRRKPEIEALRRIHGVWA